MNATHSLYAGARLKPRTLCLITTEIYPQPCLKRLFTGPGDTPTHGEKYQEFLYFFSTVNLRVFAF